MTPSEAWKKLHPEIVAVTVDIWTDEDRQEEGMEALGANIEAGNLTPDVLDVIAASLDTCWCVGAMRTAALTVLAANGKLERYDEAGVKAGTHVYSRRPRTQVILGERYVIG